jgi:hypothetical protein
MPHPVNGVEEILLRMVGHRMVIIIKWQFCRPMDDTIWKLVRIMEMQKTFISLAKNWDQHPWNTVA